MEHKYAATQIEFEDDTFYGEGMKIYQMKNTGIKHDKEKPDYSLIPPNALNELTEVLRDTSGQWPAEKLSIPRVVNIIMLTLFVV